MTDTKHTPDRIWAWYFLPEKQNEVMQGGWDGSPDKRSSEYLLATPTREAASELLEALRDMTALAIQLGAIDLEVNEARAAIAKAKGESA